MEVCIRFETNNDNAVLQILITAVRKSKLMNHLHTVTIICNPFPQITAVSRAFKHHSRLNLSLAT